MRPNRNREFFASQQGICLPRTVKIRKGPILSDNPGESRTVGLMVLDLDFDNGAVKDRADPDLHKRH